MRKHIVIDARLYGPRHTGLGRYTKNLLVALAKLANFDDYKYTLIIYPELQKEILQDLGNKYNYYVTNIRHYSFKEQLFLPFILFSLHPNIVHFTHLDKPIFYFGRSIVTVHDLIRHISKGAETTTKNPLLYWPKYLGYLLMTKIILMTSSIIVPSNFWRNYIIKKYKYNPDKIITTYEAVDPILLKNTSKIRNWKLEIGNYLLYTGNLYPHKNIIIIFKALQQLPHLKLKIICARDIFATRASAAAKHLNISSQAEFLGYVKDKDFKKIYSHALALIHPALLEGFSLTGLESMALNCPVISSNASCLPEVYGESVLYFDPYKVDELVAQIKRLQKSTVLRNKMIKLGHIQVNKFRWSTTAKETLRFYEKQIA